MDGLILAFIITMAVVLIIITSLSIALSIKNHKINMLTKSIDEFFKTGKPTEISTSDDNISHLNVDICELQNRLICEREYSKKEAQSNTEFISDISHQLKTPLAGLRLYCEMDNASNSTEHSRKELELIEKMEKLIQNILRLEKIKSDTYEMNFTEYDLYKIIADIKGELISIFPGKSININGTAKLRLDKEWMSEALKNVIKNSCEHTLENGEINIDIEESESTVSISIEDNGGGVSQEDLSKLFNRFHRAAKSAKNSAGIGLSITKAIVEKHHGIVTAYNTNKGLKISFCFPITDANIKL